jgi:hypothetical protein
MHPRTKGILRALLICIAAAAVLFLFTPNVVRTIYRGATSETEIVALKQHYRSLDASEARLPKVQREFSVWRRIAIADWLTMRGVAVDPGLRDEHVERAPLFRRVYGVKRWEWEDMFRYWRSPADLKSPAALTSEVL